ncbi:MAG TPA: leucyl aminopeptidase, partial [Paracoccus solventivorans]|nr:leucyl aminopeptidase [Paracoccus solventivorans]
MNHPVEIRFMPEADADLAACEGRLVLLIGERNQLPKGLPPAARKSLARALGSKQWGEVKPGGALEIAFPAGLAADAVQLLRLPRRA